MHLGVTRHAAEASYTGVRHAVQVLGHRAARQWAASWLALRKEPPLSDFLASPSLQCADNSPLSSRDQHWQSVGVVALQKIYTPCLHV